MLSILISRIARCVDNVTTTKAGELQLHIYLKERKHTALLNDTVWIQFAILNINHR